MSTRQTIWMTNHFTIFKDVTDMRIYIDIGPAQYSYNRAYKIWPPTLKRLY